MKKLKPMPCPFCGDPVVARATSRNCGPNFTLKRVHEIRCTSPICHARGVTVRGKSFGNVIANWNTRLGDQSGARA